MTLAEAIPIAGSGDTLPLNLFHIAARCNGAYFASKRFAAVQVPLNVPTLCRPVCSPHAVHVLAACLHAPTLPRPRLPCVRALERARARAFTLADPRVVCLFFFTDTGRLVGTGELTAPPPPPPPIAPPSHLTGIDACAGTTGPMAARLAIARAQRQLANDAGVHLHVRNFTVINTVSSPFEPLVIAPCPKVLAYITAVANYLGAWYNVGGSHFFQW